MEFTADLTDRHLYRNNRKGKARMYHRKYACKNNCSIIEKKRTFVLPVSIAWTALCAVLIVLTLLG